MSPSTGGADDRRRGPAARAPPVHEVLGPPALDRGGRSLGRSSGHGSLPRASARNHARPPCRRRRAPPSRRRQGRGGRDRPWRQVHLPRPWAARLLPDLRFEPARPGRPQVLPRPRGGRHSHGRALRARGDADRGTDRRLARLAAAQDRVDRRAHLPLGDHARLCAERRPRPGPVHRLDHGLRPRRRGVHDHRTRARPAGDGGRGPTARRRRNRRDVRARAPGASRRGSGREPGLEARGGTRSSSTYSIPFRGRPRRPTARTTEGPSPAPSTAWSVPGGQWR